jgi:hypothetical protein
MSVNVPLVLDTDEHVQVLHLGLCQCEPSCVDTRQVYHQTFSGALQALLTSLRFDAYLNETVGSLVRLGRYAYCAMYQLYWWLKL